MSRSNDGTIVTLPESALPCPPAVAAISLDSMTGDGRKGGESDGMVQVHCRYGTEEEVSLWIEWVAAESTADERLYCGTSDPGRQESVESDGRLLGLAIHATRAVQVEHRIDPAAAVDRAAVWTATDGLVEAVGAFARPCPADTAAPPVATTAGEETPTTAPATTVPQTSIATTTSTSDMASPTTAGEPGPVVFSHEEFAAGLAAIPVPEGWQSRRNISAPGEFATFTLAPDLAGYEAYLAGGLPGSEPTGTGITVFVCRGCVPDGVTVAEFLDSSRPSNEQICDYRSRTPDWWTAQDLRGLADYYDCSNGFTFIEFGVSDPVDAAWLATGWATWRDPAVETTMIAILDAAHST
jgi:hypothetical protein